MKLLIMGAGYVGMALLSRLQDSGHELYVTTTQSERVAELKPYAKEVILLNKETRQKLEACIQKCDAMVVMVAPSPGSSYEETYLQTAKIVEDSLKTKKEPFYLLYTGSTSVLENTEGTWITEEHALTPSSPHAKILTETERCYMSSNASACILRLGGIYGPGRTLEERAKRLSGKEMPGDGNEPTNNIHLEDIVEGIVFCLNHSLKGVYHLVNDDHRTRKELYETLSAKLRLPPPTWNPQLSGRKGGYRVSNEKIKSAGFVFKHPLAL